MAIGAGNQGRTSSNPSISPSSSKKRLLPRALFVAAAIVVVVVLIRDFGIQERRESYEDLVNRYENQVAEADALLAKYEKEDIDTETLDIITAKQQEVAETANVLVDLDLPNSNSINVYNQFDVEQYNGKVNTYNSSINRYAAQMSELNSLVTDANKQYSMDKIDTVNPLDVSYKPEKKILEIIGIQKVPEIASPEKADELNATISERYGREKAIRDEWNRKADTVNATQETINSLRDKVYELYGTSLDGISIESTGKVKTY